MHEVLKIDKKQINYTYCNNFAFLSHDFFYVSLCWWYLWVSYLAYPDLLGTKG
jgi:hypothetical protein